MPQSQQQSLIEDRNGTFDATRSSKDNTTHTQTSYFYLLLFLMMKIVMMMKYLRANAVDLEVSSGGECPGSEPENCSVVLYHLHLSLPWQWILWVFQVWWSC